MNRTNTYLLLLFAFATASFLVLNFNTIYAQAIDSYVSPRESKLCYGSQLQLKLITEQQALSYKWQKDGIDISSKENSYSDSAIFIINNIVFENSGTYRCKISYKNDFGSICNLYSNEAFVYVHVPTRITNCTDKRIIILGDSTQFIVSTNAAFKDSSTKPQIQWYKDNIALVDNSKISGSNSEILTIKNIQIADLSHNYKVIVNGLCGTVEQDSIVLDTLRIKIISPKNDTVCYKQNADFFASASSEEPGKTFLYQWYKKNIFGNFELIADTGRYTGTSTNHLHVNTYFTGKGPFYTPETFKCLITVMPNALDYFTDTATTTIKYFLFTKDTMTTHYHLSAVPIYMQVNFLYSKNLDFLSLQWYRNDEKIEGANQVWFCVPRATEEYAGTYYCVSECECGRDTSTFIYIDHFTQSHIASGNYFNSFKKDKFNLYTLNINLEEATNVNVSLQKLNNPDITIKIFSNLCAKGAQSLPIDLSKFNIDKGKYKVFLEINGEKSFLSELEL